MPDPSTLVSVPTVSEPTLAPNGGNVLYALEPVPNLDGDVDWTIESERVRERLIAAGCVVRVLDTDRSRVLR